MEAITDYKTLALALCEIYSPASKNQIAERIGISQKTIYNMIYGEPVGVYTQKKLIPFIKKEFGYQLKNIDGGIQLNRVCSTGNSDLLEKVVKVDDKQIEYLRAHIELLVEENNRLKTELERQAPVMNHYNYRSKSLT